MIDNDLYLYGHFFIKENYDYRDWKCGTGVQGYHKNSEAYNNVLFWNWRRFLFDPLQEDYMDDFLYPDKENSRVRSRIIKSLNDKAFTCQSFVQTPINYSPVDKTFSGCD